MPPVTARHSNSGPLLAAAACVKEKERQKTQKDADDGQSLSQVSRRPATTPVPFASESSDLNIRAALMRQDKKISSFHSSMIHSLPQS
jgi:hypothetical protein